ncbi:hypothetical protein [uncultured Desulfosarcina sp.]|uniref:hypothetical protein n=1 Tax=uncultured Desulfosarcina sp. TaxID=218289 RepID=UPI0029C6810C|nr:hypothetical protein [uncultured Desulfosarcina sp.]
MPRKGRTSSFTGKIGMDAGPFSTGRTPPADGFSDKFEDDRPWWSLFRQPVVWVERMVGIRSPLGKWQFLGKLTAIEALRPVSLVDMGADFGYRDFFFPSG